MSVHVRLRALEGLFESIYDTDRNGALSVTDEGDAGRGDVLVVRNAPGDPGNPGGRVAHEITARDLDSYDALDSWLEKASGRQVRFVYGDMGLPEYLLYTLRGASEIDGVVDLVTGSDYGRTRIAERFASPDFGGIYTAMAAEEDRCADVPRRRERRRCRSETKERYEALLTSAEIYTVEVDRLNDEMLALEGDYFSGDLDVVGIQNYIRQFERTLAAANAHDLALLKTP